MSNTSSSPYSHVLSWPPNTYFKSALIAFGLIAFAMNACLAAAILRARLWRKNHVHIYYVVLLFADLLLSVGYILSSATSIYSRGVRQALFSRLGCAAISMPFFHGNLLYTAALVCISIDRCIAVGWPLYYRLNIRRVQRILLAAALGASTAAAVGVFVGASAHEPVRTCGLGNGKLNGFRYTFTILLWVGSVAVSTLYAVSIISLRARQRSRRNTMQDDAASVDAVTDGEQRFSRLTTVLIAIEFCTTTLGLTVIVFSTAAHVERDPRLHMWIAHVCILFIQSNTLLSPAVLVCNHARLWQATKQLVGCSSDAAIEADHRALQLVCSERTALRNSVEVLTVREEFVYEPRETPEMVNGSLNELSVAVL